MQKIIDVKVGLMDVSGKVKLGRFNLTNWKSTRIQYNRAYLQMNRLREPTNTDGIQRTTNSSFL